MSRAVDAIIVYRILRKLTTPFTETPAYRLGIIDERGKILRKFSDLNSAEERDAYTLLDRLVWRLKRIIERVPFENRKLMNLTAALMLVKEHSEDRTEPMGIEVEFNRLVKEDLDTSIVEQFLSESVVKSFRMHLEDVGGGPVANSVGTGFSGQATPNPNPSLAGRDLGMGKKKIQRRKYPNV